MTLLEEIQTEAIDASSNLGTLLRKCKLLAARLDSQELEDWLVWESNGYPDDVQVPDYRIWPLEVKGNFSGIYGSGLTNTPIPYATLPDKARKFYERYECRQSIASVESILAKNDSGIVRIGTGDLAVILGQDVYQNMNCLQAWAEFSTNSLVELLNSVRNRLLDFSLAVWKEEPTAGEPSDNASGAIESSKVTQIFNTTVYGGSASLVGTVTDSNVMFEIITGDFETLGQTLRDNGVSEEDIEQLKDALESDEQPTSEGKFGPKVSSWIANMMQKAADGGWALGVGAAGNLLAQVIAKFYGL